MRLQLLCHASTQELFKKPLDKYLRKSEDVLLWGCAIIYNPCISVTGRDSEFVLFKWPFLFSLMGHLFPIYMMGLILLLLLEVNLIVLQDLCNLCILPQRGGNLTRPRCREAALQKHIQLWNVQNKTRIKLFYFPYHSISALCFSREWKTHQHAITNVHKTNQTVKQCGSCKTAGSHFG